MIAAVFLLSLFFLAYASYCDLSGGEVPDALSFLFSASMIVLAVYAFMVLGAPSFPRVFFVGAAYFVFGYLLYQFGQWGGGDVKMLAGVGLSLALLASLGLNWVNVSFAPYYIAFYFNMGLVSMPYVLAYSLLLTAKKPRILSLFVESLGSKVNLGFLFLFLVPAFVLFSRGFGGLGVLSLIPAAYFLLSLYLKGVEHEALQKTIDVTKLSEGDVLAYDLVVGGKLIASRRNIEGLTREKSEEIKNLAKEGKIPSEIRVRWGVKFIPIMAAAYALTVYAGNCVEFLLLKLLA
jgi:hypothetical protein